MPPIGGRDARDRLADAHLPVGRRTPERVPRFPLPRRCTGGEFFAPAFTVVASLPVNGDGPRRTRPTRDRLEEFGDSRSRSTTSPKPVEAGSPMTSSSGKGRYSFASYPVRVACLAALYFGAAKFGLTMAFVTEQVTAVWPPTG